MSVENYRLRSEAFAFRLTLVGLANILLNIPNLDYARDLIKCIFFCVRVVIVPSSGKQLYFFF